MTPIHRGRLHTTAGEAGNYIESAPTAERLHLSNSVIQAGPDPSGVAPSRQGIEACIRDRNGMWVRWRAPKARARGWNRVMGKGAALKC